MISKAEVSFLQVCVFKTFKSGIIGRPVGDQCSAAASDNSLIFTRKLTFY